MSDRHIVDANQFWEITRDEATVPDGSLDVLSSFGAQMISEVESRVATLESKALNVMGWTSAALAVLIAAHPTGQTRLGIAMLIAAGVGAIAAIVALIFAARALHVRSWQWPSQQDWFAEECLGDARRLKRFHLLRWLETHEAHSALAAKKAKDMRRAQLAFAVMGIALGATLLATAAASWTPTL